MQISDFRKYLSQINERIDYSEGTKEFYRKHLLVMDDWFYKNGVRAIDDITLSMLNEFIAYSRKECSETTINKRIGILKRAIRSLEIESIELAKILSLKKLKEVRRSYEMFKPGELKKVVRFVQSLPNNIPNYLMYKTFILILIDTGARVGEVLAIEKKHIDLKNTEILLKKTKTKIERTVFFNDDTSECIKDILNINNKSKFLLWNDDKQRSMNYDDVRYVMRLLEEKCKIKNIYPYMFRHTFATKLIEHGADVFTVKELMGHEKLTTTQIYTHLSKAHIKKEYKTHHKV